MSTDATSRTHPTHLTRRPLVVAGLLLGIGMGGFVDGIVFHQILQLHNMLSAVRPPTTVVNIETNMVWDGLFHAFTWMTTLIGIVALFRAGGRDDVVWSGRVLGGAMLAGWWAFNLIEGLIDHHLLGVHHVVETLGLSVWDYVYLGSGVAFLAAGGLIVRSARPRDGG